MDTKVFTDDFLQKIQHLNIHLKLKLSQGAAGGRKSNTRGTSVEFSDYREYTHFDDIRRIDWNAYGRSEKLFVKLFMEEKEAVFNLFLDSSKSMDFGEESKSIMAQRVASAIAYIALANLDSVSLNFLHEDMLIPHGRFRGRQSFYKILTLLSELKFEQGGNIAKGLQKKKIVGPGVAIIISDGMNQEGLIEGVKYLRYKKQEVIFLQILAREEIAPNYTGFVNLIDSETKDEVRVMLSSKMIQAYQDKLLNFTEELKSMCSKFGAHYLQIISDEPIEKVIFDTLVKKGMFNL